jgi:D-cysteine desulfhydrase family pyridoxal phosphate-dependent enzyme
MSLPPRFPLALLPTPLVEAPRLSKALGGPRIFFKRDDMTGFGFGGNKVRGLEFYIAEALAQNADVIVTGAGPQSNHIRATSAAARVAGLDVVAVMHDARPPETQGNLLLDELLGAQLRFTNHPDRTVVDSRIGEVAEELRRAGRRPYVIPRGGASALGALGYVECVREMEAQWQAMGVRPDWLVLSTGACGTQAGLIAGKMIHAAPYRILGVTVSRPVAECLERITRISTETARLAGRDIELQADDVLVWDGFIGPGYGIPTPEGVEAIRLVARTEGIFLDPTYTGKGMAGLIAEIRSGRIGRDEPVIFIHTGGEPALFAHAPKLLHGVPSVP